MATTKLIRLMSGDEVIVRVNKEDDSAFYVTDAISLVYHPTEDGRMSAGFAPYMPYAEDDITIFKGAVMSVSVANDTITREYTRVTTGIVTTDASGAPKTGGSGIII